MRRILVIVFLLNVANEGNVTAQVPDTLAYLRSVVANKAQFVGHPFSKLLDSLKIQVKFFGPFSAIPYDISKETSTSFSFYFPQNLNDFYLSYPRLDISWYPYLNASQSESLYTQYRAVGWSPAIRNFYSVGIISDIRILE